MATEKKAAMAVVDLRGQYLMEMDDAIALLKHLNTAARVEWDWTNKCHKYVKPDSDGMGAFKILSHIDVARIALESED